LTDIVAKGKGCSEKCTQEWSLIGYLRIGSHTLPDTSNPWEGSILERSVRNWTPSGILVTVTALIIEIMSIYFQTNPGVNYTGIINGLIVLLITGGVIIAGAIWEWKQEVNSIHVIILIVIGLVGFGVSVSFHNALMDAFFPRTSISVFLGINFIAVAMVGFFLWIFRRLPLSNER